MTNISHGGQFYIILVSKSKWMTNEGACSHIGKKWINHKSQELKKTLCKCIRAMKAWIKVGDHHFVWARITPTLKRVVVQVRDPMFTIALTECKKHEPFTLQWWLAHMAPPLYSFTRSVHQHLGSLPHKLHSNATHTPQMPIIVATPTCHI